MQVDPKGRSVYSKSMRPFDLERPKKSEKDDIFASKVPVLLKLKNQKDFSFWQFFTLFHLG